MFFTNKHLFNCLLKSHILFTLFVTYNYEELSQTKLFFFYISFSGIKFSIQRSVYNFSYIIKKTMKMWKIFLSFIQKIEEQKTIIY
jgi:hypothetical protein